MASRSKMALAGLESFLAGHRSSLTSRNVMGSPLELLQSLSRGIVQIGWRQIHSQGLHMVGDMRFGRLGARVRVVMLGLAASRGDAKGKSVHGCCCGALAELLQRIVLFLSAEENCSRLNLYEEAVASGRATSRYAMLAG